MRRTGAIPARRRSRGKSPAADGGLFKCCDSQHENVWGVYLRRRHAQDARKAIREKGHIVLTNPDMLHTGILPHHTRVGAAV